MISQYLEGNCPHRKRLSQEENQHQIQGACHREWFYLENFPLWDKYCVLKASVYMGIDSVPWYPSDAKLIESADWAGHWAVCCIKSLYTLLTCKTFSIMLPCPTNTTLDLSDQKSVLLRGQKGWTIRGLNSRPSQYAVAFFSIKCEWDVIGHYLQTLLEYCNTHL